MHRGSNLIQMKNIPTNSSSFDNNSLSTIILTRIKNNKTINPLIRVIIQALKKRNYHKNKIKDNVVPILDKQNF